MLLSPNNFNKDAVAVPVGEDAKPYADRENLASSSVKRFGRDLGARNIIENNKFLSTATKQIMWSVSVWNCSMGGSWRQDGTVGELLQGRGEQTFRGLSIRTKRKCIARRRCRARGGRFRKQMGFIRLRCRLSSHSGWVRIVSGKSHAIRRQTDTPVVMNKIFRAQSLRHPKFTWVVLGTFVFARWSTACIAHSPTMHRFKDWRLKVWLASATRSSPKLRLEKLRWWRRSRRRKHVYVSFFRKQKTRLSPPRAIDIAEHESRENTGCCEGFKRSSSIFKRHREAKVDMSLLVPFQPTSHYHDDLVKWMALE